MTDLRQTFIHGEALARPVGRGAEAAHLLGDGVAGIFLPLPDFFDELLAAEVVARDALCIELAFDHDLRGDARVVGARLPQRVVAAHAVVARERIHQGLVEAVAHVQRAGDVGRRQLDAEIVFLGGVEAGLEVAGVFPGGVPAGFDVFRVKTFGEFHCGLFGECVFREGGIIQASGVLEGAVRSATGILAQPCG